MVLRSWRWIVPLALAAAIWLLPHGRFDGRSWGLLCLFAAAICGLITRPIAAGAIMITTIASGALLLNGQPADLASIEAEFKRLQTEKGVVWYYRDNPMSEPSPAAMAVVQLVIQYRLPISFSSKPDFSDYVDENGRSQPRKR